jgi:hypothetical protein
MIRVPATPLFQAGLIACVLVSAAATAGPMIRAGRETEVLDLARPVVLDGAVGGGWVLDGVAIGDGEIRFTLRGDGRGDCGLLLAPRSDGDAPGTPSFRVDHRGTAPGCRAATDRLAARIEANDPGDFWDVAPDPVRAPGEAPSAPTEGPDPWTPAAGLLWGLLALSATIRMARFRGPWRAVPAPMGLFALSLVSVLLLAPRGPGDGHLNLAAAFRTGPALEWGPAPVALLRGLALLIPLDGGVIAALNLLAAAAAPALLYLLLRRLDLGALPAALAAALTGLSPLLLCSAGSLNRQPLFLLCCLAGLLLAAGYLRRGAALDLVGAGAAFALAALSRPEGAAVLLLGGLLALADRRAPRRSLALGALCGALAGAALVYLATAFRGSDLAAGHDLTAAGWLAVLRYSALLRPGVTPTPWLVVWIVALVAGARRAPGRAALALLSVLGLTLAWTATPVGGQLVGFELQVASLRYQTLLLVPLGLGLALGLQELIVRWPRRGPRATVALAAVLAAVALVPPSPALRPTVIDHEYRFLAGRLPALPRAARICVLLPGIPDLGLNDATLVSDFVGRPDIQWVHARDGVCPMADPVVPTFYYRGAWCTPAQDHPAHRYDADAYAALLADCAALEETAEGTPVAAVDVPAVRWAWYDYSSDTVRIGLYEL